MMAGLAAVVVALCACFLQSALSVPVGLVSPLTRFSALQSDLLPPKYKHVPQEANETLAGLASILGENQLVAYLNKTGLLTTFSDPAATLTLFGPTDAAFSALSPAVRNTLDNNPQAAKAILSYHAISEEFRSRDLTNEQLLPSMLQGLSIRINIYPSTNTITASGRRVILADQSATNGVLHELSDVMLPPGGQITSVFSEVPDLAILLQAVTSAGLTETLAGPGPFTVFAPTDQAFEALPPGELDRILKNPTLLKQVLLYHVLNGTLYSAGLSAVQKVPSLDSGRNLTIRNTGGAVTVNNAYVTFADLSATNGVLHLIDSVLMPFM